MKLSFAYLFFVLKSVWAIVKPIFKDRAKAAAFDIAGPVFKATIRRLMDSGIRGEEAKRRAIEETRFELRGMLTGAVDDAVKSSLDALKVSGEDVLKVIDGGDSIPNLINEIIYNNLKSK